MAAERLIAWAILTYRSLPCDSSTSTDSHASHCKLSVRSWCGVEATESQREGYKLLKAERAPDKNRQLSFAPNACAQFPIFGPIPPGQSPLLYLRVAELLPHWFRKDSTTDFFIGPSSQLIGHRPFKLPPRHSVEGTPQKGLINTFTTRAPSHPMRATSGCFFDARAGVHSFVWTSSLVRCYYQ